MTNAGRATWSFAKGSKHQGGIDYVKSKQVSAQDVIIQPELKQRSFQKVIKEEQLYLTTNTIKKRSGNQSSEKEIKEIKENDKKDIEIKELKELPKERNKRIQELQSIEKKEKEKEIQEKESKQIEEIKHQLEKDDGDGILKRKWYEDVVLTTHDNDDSLPSAKRKIQTHKEKQSHLLDKYVK